jgi:hypothetical protein
MKLIKVFLLIEMIKSSHIFCNTCAQIQWYIMLQIMNHFGSLIVEAKYFRLQTLIKMLIEVEKKHYRNK